MIPGNPTLPPGVLLSDIDWSDFECHEDDECEPFECALERAERYFDDNQRDD